MAGLLQDSLAENQLGISGLGASAKLEANQQEYNQERRLGIGEGIGELVGVLGGKSSNLFHGQPKTDTDKDPQSQGPTTASGYGINTPNGSSGLTSDQTLALEQKATDLENGTQQSSSNVEDNGLGHIIGLATSNLWGGIMGRN